jgi:flagellar basal-body rod modification protein FlgD
MLIDSATSTAAAGTKAATDQAKIQEDLNDFLKLLTTQLQNQDPLEPMDANEFTQQLVQFATVEQQIQQNANLENLIDIEANNQVGAMVSFLDKAIEYEGSQLSLSDGRSEASYTLAETAKDVAIEIVDANGNTIHEESGTPAAGRHSFTWDGRDSSGNIVPDGAYTFVVTATDADGAPVDVSTTVTAVVDSVQSVDGQLVLLVDDTAVHLDQLVSVTDQDQTLLDQASDIVDDADDSLF